MRKLFGFFRRDFLLMTSYRFRLVLDMGYTVAGVLFLFFIGKTFSGGFSAYLSRYGNDYFAFSVIGMAVSAFVSTGLYSLADEIRNAQVQGTLETLLMTPTSPTTILFGSTLWSFIESFLYCVFYLGAAAFMLKIELSLFRVGLTLLVLFLTFCCFLALGMVSAAFIMVFKQGNPITMVFGTSSYFLGGLVFPVEVLPAPVRAFSALLPMTQAAAAVREILLVPLAEARWTGAALYLGGFAAVLLPLGMLSLRYSLKRAKKDGSLVQF